MNTEINFLINEMTFLKLFMPLVVEGNKRGIKSNFFYAGANGKYSCVNTKKNKLLIQGIVKEYDIEYISAEPENMAPIDGPFFCICGVGSERVPEGKTIFSLTYGSDFISMYDGYIDRVDHVIFPGFDFAHSTEKMSKKNLYLGSPKFCVSYNREQVCEKYELDKESRKALIIYPDHSKYPPRINLDVVYDALRQSGYEVIVKTRGKNRSGKDASDYYFEDPSWYPHTTLELIEASDLVVTHAASATIKEIINFKKPFLDLDVKFLTKSRPTIRDNFSFLYKYDFYRIISGNMDVETVKKKIKVLEKGDFTDQFDLAIKEHFCDKDAICANILDKAFELTK